VSVKKTWLLQVFNLRCTLTEPTRKLPNGRFNMGPLFKVGHLRVPDMTPADICPYS
jgi:hypothetical protein